MSEDMCGEGLEAVRLFYQRPEHKAKNKKDSDFKSKRGRLAFLMYPGTNEAPLARDGQQIQTSSMCVVGESCRCCPKQAKKRVHGWHKVGKPAEDHP